MSRTLLLLLYLENIEFRLHVPDYSEIVISRHIVGISGHIGNLRINLGKSEVVPTFLNLSSICSNILLS